MLGFPVAARSACPSRHRYGLSRKEFRCLLTDARAEQGPVSSLLAEGIHVLAPPRERRELGRLDILELNYDAARTVGLQATESVSPHAHTPALGGFFQIEVVLPQTQALSHAKSEAIDEHERCRLQGTNARRRVRVLFEQPERSQISRMWTTLASVVRCPCWVATRSSAQSISEHRDASRDTDAGYASGRTGAGGFRGQRAPPSVDTRPPTPRHAVPAGRVHRILQ